ncbi:MAG: hypothetical protein COA58_09460 [Bacteroidetes bacterium]|nr:MAG: hypothetical protein COA58_09460 [Bacteroidota bacterium]
MKLLNLNFFIFFLAIVTLVSCAKEETPTVVNDTFVPMDSDSLTLSGTFMSDVHPTSGTISVFDDGTEQTIAFEDFKSDNGPDLRVYVSTSLSDNEFIELGKLTAVSGSFSYKTSSTTDLSKFKNVLIWCEDFDVLFGHAVLK